MYGLNNTDVNILCKAKLAVDYCWFTHPNGHKISVSDQMAATEQDLYRYFGTGLDLGECGITVRRATIPDTGNWVCHMGTLVQIGFETTKTVKVRVSGNWLS